MPLGKRVIWHSHEKSLNAHIIEDISAHATSDDSLLTIKVGATKVRAIVGDRQSVVQMLADVLDLVSERSGDV